MSIAVTHVGRDSLAGMDSLRAGRSRNRISVGARYYPPFQTGHGAHPASYVMSTVSFPVIERPGYIVDYSNLSRAEAKENKAVHLLYLWAFVACSRVHFVILGV